MEENNQNPNNPTQPPTENSIPEQNPTSQSPKPAWQGYPLPKAVIVGIVLFLIIIIIGTASAAYLFVNKNSNIQKGCTLEAKICPDGSAVGRTGPKCEFASCPKSPTPTPNPIASWKTYTNSTYGYSIKYPPDWKQEGQASSFVGPGVAGTNPSGLPPIVSISVHDEVDSEEDIVRNYGQSIYKIVEHDNSKFLIILSTYIDGVSGEDGMRVLNANKDIFNQIFSTFKFTN